MRQSTEDASVDKRISRIGQTPKTETKTAFRRNTVSKN